MIVFPNAKINFGLRITRKRSDGYHDIETIFYSVGLSDALEFSVFDQSVTKDSLSQTGIQTGTNDEDNLVIKIIRRLRQEYTFPFLKIHLHKAIPVGSGLGGGSSDAAYILKSVIRYFNLPITEKKLEEIALETGSDCPFFIHNVPSIATGRGEILSPLPLFLSGFYIVLIKPVVSISTREAYANCKPAVPEISLDQQITLPSDSWKEVIKNDFEEYAFRTHPVIGEIKEELYRNEAVFSLMSGSGSCVYGIFRHKPTLPDNLRRLVIWEGEL